jgi:hypothetical protein
MDAQNIDEPLLHQPCVSRHGAIGGSRNRRIGNFPLLYDEVTISSG